MWRYECKRHLLYLLCGAVVGMILYFLVNESVFQHLWKQAIICLIQMWKWPIISDGSLEL